MKILKDFTKFEKIWVSLFTVLILGTTAWFSYLYTDYGSLWNIALNWLISPLSALTGIFCVVLAAKGKISTFTWGVVNTLSYGTLALVTGIYGDAIINLLYFLPLQFVGLVVWKKKMKKENKNKKD
jgi:nicotinamide mononucleotide transporter